MKTMINIELTDQEAQLFKDFQQHHDTFMVLNNSGVFDIKNGTALLNFDSIGTLTDVDCSFKLFKKGKATLLTLRVVK